MEGSQLAPDGLTAVDRQHPDTEAATVAMNGLGHLHGQLPGGNQNQRHGVAAALVGRREALEERQRKCGGLPGPGGSLAEHVAPFEQNRYGGLLDRGRLLVAEAGQGRDQLGAQLEVTERDRPAGLDVGQLLILLRMPGARWARTAGEQAFYAETGVLCRSPRAPRRPRGAMIVPGVSSVPAGPD